MSSAWLALNTIPRDRNDDQQKDISNFEPYNWPVVYRNQVSLTPLVKQKRQTLFLVIGIERKERETLHDGYVQWQAGSRH